MIKYLNKYLKIYKELYKVIHRIYLEIVDILRLCKIYICFYINGYIK
jgi:hypothetical protein